MESTPYNTRIYTDFQGLQQLQHNPDSAAAKKEVSLQFEAILMQMVMHSMRDANKAFSKDSMFGGDQMDLYQDMFDKQLSLVMSSSGTGFADIVEKNIDQMSKSHEDYASTPAAIPVAVNATESQVTIQQPVMPQSSIPVPKTKSEKTTEATTPTTFLQKIWPFAQKAASALGLSPEILVAQVVLETNWGKSVIANGTHESSYNVFNIKADTSWKNKTVTVSSLEERNHILVKEKSQFRSYQSYEESFMDYVSFLKQNSRYQDALRHGNNPEGFVSALQDAGYATDSNYANKILSVYSSRTFQSAINRLKQGDLSF